MADAAGDQHRICVEDRASLAGQLYPATVVRIEVFFYSGVAQCRLQCGKRVGDNDLRTGEDVVLVYLPKNVGMTERTPTVPSVVKLRYTPLPDLSTSGTIDDDLLATLDTDHEFVVPIHAGRECRGLSNIVFSLKATLGP